MLVYTQFTLSFGSYCNAPNIFVSLFIFIISFTTNKPNEQGVIAILKDKALYTMTEYNMGHFYTYSNFMQSYTTNDKPT